MQFSKFRSILLFASLAGASIFVAPPAPSQIAVAQNTSHKPFLHALFSENAVLQRDRPVPVWGWTTPGKKVAVELDDKTFAATADATGRWMTRIGPYPAGGPHTLKVTGTATTESVTRRNILFGDVWLCAGQSNMGYGLKRNEAATQEIANANYPQIRLFTVPRRIAEVPQTDLRGGWLECTPQNIVAGAPDGFSAVAYFFGRKLHQELKVPIGLIKSAWGGTIAEAWMSDSALGTIPDFKTPVEVARNTRAHPEVPIDQKVDAWLKIVDKAYDPQWTKPDGDGATWKEAELPNYWEQLGNPELNGFDGIGLFRREVTVPQAWVGHDLTVTLGAIDDRDTTYWNGSIIGSTKGARIRRSYKIPGALVKAGRGVIGVRIMDTGGKGGLSGPANVMQLTLDANDKIPLAGKWKYRVSVPASQFASMPAAEDTTKPNRVSVLYNGMIAPLEPLALKGAIWYQGESNAKRPEQYSRLLPVLIGDWRQHFGSVFPFHLVQLAGYGPPVEKPGDNNWSLLRAAQQHTADTVPQTGIAIITDNVDEKGMHPTDKRNVGLRLALDALALDYGKKIEYSGPVLQSALPKGAQIVLTFTHADGGLSLKGDADHVFAIAGADKVWAWAKPRIEGTQVTLSAPNVTNPVYVRYAWASNPRGTLYNGASLPAPPFQTTPQISNAPK